MKKIQVAIVSILLTGTLSVRSDDIVVSSTEALLLDVFDCAGVSTRHLTTINPNEHLKQLARDAISADASVSTPAITLLRAEGPEGLRALFDEHAELLKSGLLRQTTAIGPPSLDKLVWLKTALDAVSQQRDCYSSGLYWHTDFDGAKAAAKATGKPILSLRLLGKLDEEFSCANSRFFRTTLYANKEVSGYLREHFVLHWKSVRPVPRVTIDFGDGRKLERTITGNSIHYVLDSEGKVIDALPGLYGGRAFLRELGRAGGIARQSASLARDAREQLLADYHHARAVALRTAYAADLRTVNGNGDAINKGITLTPISLSSAPPTAQAAGRLAVGKGRVEMPMLKATSPIFERAANQAQPASLSEDEVWKRIAALHAEDARLDNGSKALMRSKNLMASDAGRRAMAKFVTEDPLLRALRNLERSIAEDTVRNEYLFHSKIHEWLASGHVPADVEKLNTKVYAELFLTPDSDPWLGLVPRDTYTALENDGLTQTVGR